MSILLRVPEGVERRMLPDLCASAGSCRIVYRVAPDRKLRSTVRLLAVSDESLITEWPHYQNRPAPLAPGEKVRFYFLWQNRRYTAVTTVRKPLRWPTDDGKTMPALSVDYPRSIEKAPLREGFRLSMLHGTPTAITLRWSRILNELTARWIQGDCSVAPSDIAAAHRLAIEEAARGARGDLPDPRVACCHGELLNLSESGCCAVFAEVKVHHAATGDLYVAGFQLAGEKPIHVVAEIRWIRPHPDGRRIMAGMAWQLDPDDAQHRSIRERIERFIARQQGWTGCDWDRRWPQSQQCGFDSGTASWPDKGMAAASRRGHR